MIKEYIKHITLAIILGFCQVHIFDNIYIIGYFNAFVYVLSILLLPPYMNKFLVLLYAFILGFTIDIFNSTPGMHAAASVLLAFLRPYILSIFSPRDGYELSKELGSRTYGNAWFFSYSLVLIFPHHVLLYMMEILSVWHIFPALLKALTSTIATIFFIYLGNLLFVKK